MKYKISIETFYKESQQYSDFIDIGYLVSNLSNLENVSISVKLNKYSYFQVALSNLIESPPNAIMIQIDQDDVEMSMEYIKSIKTSNKDIKIIVFGREPSINPKYFLLNNTDVCIIGEIEITAKQLIFTLMNNSELEGCEGIAFLKDEQIIINNNRVLEDNINNLLPPNRTFLSGRIVNIRVRASRGCKGHCIFCDSNYYYMQKGSKVRCRKLVNVVDEIKGLIDNYSVKYIRFDDETFEGHNITTWLNEFYHLIINNNLKFRFAISLRAELINEDVIKHLINLQNVGLDSIFLGFESGNNVDLKFYGKRANIEDNIRASKLLNSYDINYEYGFIMFHPYSQLNSLTDNVKFFTNNNIFTSFEIMSRKLRVYSGSRIKYKLEKDDLLKCAVDEPILNCFDYEFQDQWIKELLLAFELFNDILPNITLNYVKWCSLYGNLRYSSLLYDNEHILEYFNKLNASKLKISSICCHYANKILSLYGEKSKDIIMMLDNDLKDYDFEMHEIINGMTKNSMLISRELLRRKELYQRETKII